jgi:hypothetical protein
MLVAGLAAALRGARRSGNRALARAIETLLDDARRAAGAGP